MSAWYTANFNAVNNADFEHVFRMKDTAGAAINLTGAAFEMDIRTKTGTEIATLTTANMRIAITDAANGEFLITLPVAVVRTLPVGAYSHDLIMTQAGVVSRIWAGSFIVAKGITA